MPGDWAQASIMWKDLQEKICGLKRASWQSVNGDVFMDKKMINAWITHEMCQRLIG